MKTTGNLRKPLSSRMYLLWKMVAELKKIQALHCEDKISHIHRPSYSRDTYPMNTAG